MEPGHNLKVDISVRYMTSSSVTKKQQMRPSPLIQSNRPTEKVLQDSPLVLEAFLLMIVLMYLKLVVKNHHLGYLREQNLGKFSSGSESVNATPK